MEEVQRDELAGLFGLLEAACPGYKPSLTVCGLASYMQKRERQEGARVRRLLVGRGKRASPCCLQPVQLYGLVGGGKGSSGKW